MDYAKESLKLHYEWQGKIEITARAKANDKESLSLAYTPGVAEPCLEIHDIFICGSEYDAKPSYTWAEIAKEPLILLQATAMQYRLVRHMVMK